MRKKKRRKRREGLAVIASCYRITYPLHSFSPLSHSSLAHHIPITIITFDEQCRGHSPSYLSLPSCTAESPCRPSSPLYLFKPLHSPHHPPHTLIPLTNRCSARELCRWSVNPLSASCIKKASKQRLFSPPIFNVVMAHRERHR